MDDIVNGIGDEGARMISEALTINKTIRKLALKSKGYHFKAQCSLMISEWFYSKWYWWWWC